MHSSTSFRITDILGVSNEESSDKNDTTDDHKSRAEENTKITTKKDAHGSTQPKLSETSEEKTHLEAFNLAVQNLLSSASRHGISGKSKGF